MFIQHFALGFQPGLYWCSLVADAIVCLGLAFQMGTVWVAALETSLYLWIVECCFTERKRELSRHVGHRCHRSPMNSRGLVWGVTSSPSHSVSCQSLLTMVQGGTSSALEQMAVLPLVNKGSPGPATQGLMLNLQTMTMRTQKCPQTRDEKWKYGLKMVFVFRPRWTPLLQRGLTGFCLAVN